MSISISTIGAVASLAAAFYLFKSKKDTKQKPPQTTQELIRYKNISPEGTLELENHKYRMIIEVEPINTSLKSESEQEALWVGFRDMINTLTIPVTFLVQTRHLDLKDYISELETIVNRIAIPELKDYGNNLCKFLSQKEEKNVRDRRHYIILKIDALAANNIDSGIKIENEAINALLSDLKPKKTNNMSSEELKDLAFQELDTMASIIQGTLSSLEIPSIRLNRDGVLDLIYSTFNRDLAPHARFVDVNAQQMFSLTTKTLTPFMTGGDDNASEPNVEHEEKAS